MLGIHTSDLHLVPKDALRQAVTLHAQAVEIESAFGQLTAKSLSSSGRRHLARLVDGLGLVFASLSADPPHMRLTDPATSQERIDLTCDALEMAADMRVPIVTTAVGALTHPDTGEPSPTALDALTQLGEFADSRGVRLAIRPGYDSAERIADVLRAVACPALSICIDPAAMVMAGQNPIALLERCSQEVILVHARDGNTGRIGNPGIETRLGEGEVNLIGVFRTLREMEYRGHYILRRLDSQTPMEDLTHARQVVESHLKD